MNTLLIFLFFWRSLQSVMIWAPLAVFATATAVVFWRSEPVQFWKYLLLLTLPLLWIFVAIWGGLFSVDWQAKPFVPNPQWVGLVVLLAIGLYVTGSIALIVYLRGIRLFVTLFAVLNLFFMLAISALASMAISGDWL
jgi:hypothetical protein